MRLLFTIGKHVVFQGKEGRFSAGGDRVARRSSPVAAKRSLPRPSAQRARISRIVRYSCLFTHFEWYAFDVNSLFLRRQAPIKFFFPVFRNLSVTVFLRPCGDDAAPCTDTILTSLERVVRVEWGRMMRTTMRLFNAILDTCLTWFTPLWRRRAHETRTMLRRYMRQYGPQIPEERMEQMRRSDQSIGEALLHWRKGEAEQQVRQAEEEYGQLPGYRRGLLVEFVESVFVIIVVFLGIRTYFVQPFRIPTNSMWPSLNGIVVHPVDEVPGVARRIWDAVTLGSSYVDIAADRPKQIKSIRDERHLLLFTRTIISFDEEGRDVISIPAASGTVIEYLRSRGKRIDTPRGPCYLPYKAGETIMRARVDAGDMVLVNRLAYHFRRPRRGETFVFDTRGINTSGSASVSEQSHGTHYIKRLCALPGDSVRIESPHLIVNGKVADEPGIARVSAGMPPARRNGYMPLEAWQYPTGYLTRDKTLHLADPGNALPNLREYLALGDNTTGSLDSRYWGPVKQFNILGPAGFTLWPFTAHWGMID